MAQMVLIQSVFELDVDQLIRLGTQADLFRIVQTRLPVGVRVDQVELVLSHQMLVRMALCQLAST